MALDPYTETVTRERESGLWQCIESSSDGHNRRVFEYTYFIPSVRMLVELPITE